MIEEQAKIKVKEIFNEWLDLLDSRSEITSQMTDLKNEVAGLLDLKSATITKLFNHLKKVYEGGDDDFSNIIEITEQLEN